MKVMSTDDIDRKKSDIISYDMSGMINTSGDKIDTDDRNIQMVKQN